MNEIREILVVVYAPSGNWNGARRARIDTEFWREGRKFKAYEDISAKKFSTLCSALREYKMNTVTTDNDSMIITYRIR